MSTFWAPRWLLGRGSEQSPLPAAGRGALAPREDSASVVEAGSQEGMAGHTAGQETEASRWHVDWTLKMNTIQRGRARRTGFQAKGPE